MRCFFVGHVLKREPAGRGNYTRLGKGKKEDTHAKAKKREVEKAKASMSWTCSRPVPKKWAYLGTVRKPWDRMQMKEGSFQVSADGRGSCLLLERKGEKQSGGANLCLGHMLCLKTISRCDLKR